jgi:hypothetical protein
VGRPQQFSSKRKEKFPWILLVVLALTTYLFWILPLQLGPRPVKVEFSKLKSR